MVLLYATDLAPLLILLLLLFYYSLHLVRVVVVGIAVAGALLVENNSRIITFLLKTHPNLVLRHVHVEGVVCHLGSGRRVLVLLLRREAVAEAADLPILTPSPLLAILHIKLDVELVILGVVIHITDTVKVHQVLLDLLVVILDQRQITQLRYELLSYDVGVDDGALDLVLELPEDLLDLQNVVK